MKNTFILLVILFSCTPKSPPVVKIMQQNSGTTESYRGLSVVNATTAWISGTNGSVLRTKNAGASWENVSIPGADSIDFRDIEAFSDDTAIVISAGSPGLIYKTTDGGINWQEVYKDDRPEIFFDAMGFWDSQSGIAFSDAINGKIILVKTDDGGDSWQQLSNDLLPDALDHEGGFAASGTCLITLGDSVVMIALGTPRSRFMKSNNRGIDWEIVETPMVQEVAGAGIFSIAFSTSEFGIAVGGNYTLPNDSAKTLAITKDGGRSWQLLENSGINGYKSAICAVPDTEYWLCSGPTGINLSINNGLIWHLIDTTAYHTVMMANKNTGWLSGANGKIARLTFE